MSGGPFPGSISPPRPATRFAAPALAALAFAALALQLTATSIRAEEPPQLRERVTDLAGVMSEAHVAQAEEALAELNDRAGVQMFVLVVSTLEGMTVTAYADEVAARSSLGRTDALLLVAVEDGRDALWISDLLTEATPDEIEAILADGVEPQLAEEDWGAAAEAAALGLADALEVAPSSTPSPTPNPTASPAPGPAAGEDGIPWALVALVAVGLVALALAGLILWRPASAGSARR